MSGISVVAYRDGDLWVAQCVEYDIAARADSLERLPRAFDRALAANMLVNAELGRSKLEGIPPAPSRFKPLFDEAQEIAPLEQIRPTEIRMRLAEAA